MQYGELALFDAADKPLHLAVQWPVVSAGGTCTKELPTVQQAISARPLRVFRVADELVDLHAAGHLVDAHWHLAPALVRYGN